jgi:hypothetical protein
MARPRRPQYGSVFVDGAVSSSGGEPEPLWLRRGYMSARRMARQGIAVASRAGRPSVGRSGRLLVRSGGRCKR